MLNWMANKVTHYKFSTDYLIMWGCPDPVWSLLTCSQIHRSSIISNMSDIYLKSGWLYQDFLSWTATTTERGNSQTCITGYNNKLLHHTYLHFVCKVASRVKPHHLLLIQNCINIKCIMCPNCTKFNIALRCVLGNKPVKRGVDRMNCSWDKNKVQLDGQSCFVVR